MLMALLSRHPEALVMVGSPATPASVELLRRAGIPVAETWDLPAQPIDAVAGFDNRAAGITVARHFAAAGRRRLAFVGGDYPARNPTLEGIPGGLGRSRIARTAPSSGGAQCRRRRAGGLDFTG
jgi:DNA-binding LacI/PurR family transcriptional regulator